MPPRRFLLRALRWIAAALLILPALAVTAAPLLRLQHIAPFAQAVSARGLVATALLVAALAAFTFFSATAIRRRRIIRSINPRSRARNKPVPPPFPAISLTLALALAATGGINLAVLSARGLDSGARTTLEGLAATPAEPGEVTVVVLNTQWTNVPVADIAELIRASEADVVLLPETPIIVAIHVTDVLALDGTPFQAIPLLKRDSRDTSLLVAESFGLYDDGGSPILGSAQAIPAEAGPTITAVHAFPPPTPWPLSALYGIPDTSDHQARWVNEVRDAVGQCRADAWGIVGGDFNATRDHTAWFDDCGYVDVMVEAGAGGWGTWPDAVPAFLGAPIDRVLVDPAHWTPTAGWIVEMQGTDHRAVVARMMPFEPGAP